MNGNLNHKTASIPVLMYHRILDDHERVRQEKDVNPAYSMSMNLFQQQINYLVQGGYQTLSLDDVLISPGTVRKSLSITFDDGWIDNYIYAFPVLREMNLKATVFVVTDFIGKREYLTWDHLREMDKGGISVQSHTVSHKPLAVLKTAAIVHELEVSKKTLEERLGKRVDYLSLPHGSYNRECLEIAHNVGYEAVCTSEPGYSHAREGELSILSRINITDRLRISDFEKILSKNYLALLPIMASKKTKNLVRRILGYKTYRKLYELRYPLR